MSLTNLSPFVKQEILEIDVRRSVDVYPLIFTRCLSSSSAVKQHAQCPTFKGHGCLVAAATFAKSRIKTCRMGACASGMVGPQQRDMELGQAGCGSYSHGPIGCIEAICNKPGYLTGSELRFTSTRSTSNWCHVSSRGSPYRDPSPLRGFHQSPALLFASACRVLKAPVAKAGTSSTMAQTAWKLLVMPGVILGFQARDDSWLKMCANYMADS